MPDFNFIAQGWECPKCKRVYSPATMMCMVCPNQPTTTGVSTTPVFLTGTTSICTQFIAEADSGTNPDPKCIKCGKSRFQHPTSIFNL